MQLNGQNVLLWDKSEGMFHHIELRILKIELSLLSPLLENCLLLRHLLQCSLSPFLWPPPMQSAAQGEVGNPAGPGMCLFSDG